MIWKQFAVSGSLSTPSMFLKLIKSLSGNTEQINVVNLWPASITRSNRHGIDNRQAQQQEQQHLKYQDLILFRIHISFNFYEKFKEIYFLHYFTAIFIATLYSILQNCIILLATIYFNNRVNKSDIYCTEHSQSEHYSHLTNKA